jgi:SAM-dependent methyltransferase
MSARVFLFLCRVAPIKKLLWRWWYEFLAGLHRTGDWSFMNYGYAAIPANPIALDTGDEANRYSVQLYHAVINDVSLADLRVLEVGSGRGGGAAYIKRYHKTAEMVGVDFSARAVAMCNDVYNIRGLSFVQGDAENLPFDDNAFDAIINVESSHCYGSVDVFLLEVKRVLRPGGYFLYADFRDLDKMQRWRQQISDSGLILVNETDITANVVAALDADDERKNRLINQLVPKFLLNSFRDFSGVKGSAIYKEFRAGVTPYLQFLLKKRQ